MTLPAELVLRTFILDYLNKRGLTSAAEALCADHLQKSEHALSCPPVDSPNGFLFEWFGLFWDVFYTRLQAKVYKNRWHHQQNPPQHPLQQSAQQNHHPRHPPQQQHPHSVPHQPPQHSHQPHHQQHHPSQQQHLQHPPSQSPHISSQQHDNPLIVPSPQHPHNPQQHLNSNVPVDVSLPMSANPNIQNPAQLPSANIPQNHNVFSSHPAVDQHRQRKHPHASQPMLNPHAFRNTNPAMSNPQSQVQNQQMRQQKLHQQQAIMEHAQRQQQQPSSTTPASARMRNNSVDNRRPLAQSQLAVQSLSLNPSLQPQKPSVPPEQPTAPSVPLSGDMLDANALDSVLSTVGTRNTQPRNNAAASNAAAAAAAAAASRGMMQQMGARPQPSQMPMASFPLSHRGGAPAKSRQYGGLPVGSEAPSSASRRGPMDIPMNAGRPYEDAAVEDESQPRPGPTGTSSSSKKRAASQNISRKSTGSSLTDTASPRAVYGSSEGGAPAKRQRATGVYQGNGSEAPLLQQIQQHQKQLSGVDIEQISRGYPQGQTAARGRSAQLMALQQQRQQTFPQGTEQVNSAQFLPQIGAGDKGNAVRNGGRYPGRQAAGAAPSPSSYMSHEQAMNSRQPGAFIQAQMSGGRRTPLSAVNDRDKNSNAEGRGSSGGQKGGDTNFAMSQAAAQAAMVSAAPGLPLTESNLASQMSSPSFFYFLDKMNMSGNSGAFSGLTGSLNADKKLNHNGEGEGNVKEEGQEEQSGIKGQKQHNEAQISEQIQRDTQMSLQGNGLKEDNASLRLRQQFGRDDLLKASGTMPLTDHDMELGSDKKLKPESIVASNAKGTGARGELKRNSSSRAMKTIETTGLSRTRARPDSSSKSNGMNGPTSGMNQIALGTMGAVSKREKGATEVEMENRSTKSDRQPSTNRGGGTPSQKSTASGGSGAVDMRAIQGTSSTTRKGRGRSRGRGSGNRRPRADRGAPPRGGNTSRSGNSSQLQRATGLEQKTNSSAAMQLTSEATRGPSNDVDGRNNIPTSSILTPPRGNVQTLEGRGQTQKPERNGRSHGKHAESQGEMERASKLSFENEDTGNPENRGQGQSIERQQSNSHLHTDNGPLLEMLQQSSNVGSARSGGDIPVLEHVDKAFTMQQLNLVTGAGGGKMGVQGGGNYQYDIQQYLGEEETDIGSIFPPMQDNMALDQAFTEDNIL